MKIVLITLSFVLAFASCGMFDQGKAGRNTNLIGGQGQGTVLCKTSADCEKYEVCTNGVCVDNPILGTGCTSNSDCGSSILYTCTNGTCQKITLQEAEAEAKPGVLLGSATLDYDETFTSSASECKSGVAQAGTSKCGCAAADDPCGINTPDGQICKTTKVCGNPGLAHSDFYIPDVETAPYGFENIYVISGGANTIACNGNDLKLPLDLNESVGGSFIYLCFKYASKGEAAVNGIYFTSSPNGGYQTPQSGYTAIGPDLNQGASGNYIYTYIRKGTANIITRFRLAIGGDGNSTQLSCINHWGDNGYIIAGPDLNDQAGGQYIFACYK